jgi:hypothetical protein
MLGQVVCLSAGCEENEVAWSKSKQDATNIFCGLLRKSARWRGGVIHSASD